MAIALRTLVPVTANTWGNAMAIVYMPVNCASWAICPLKPLEGGE